MMTANQLAKMISKCLPVESMIRNIDCQNNQSATFYIEDPLVPNADRSIQITVTSDGNYKILDLA